MSTVYDTGVLVAADRDERAIWADHRIRLEMGIVPVTTAPVVAQASRSPRQARLRQLLRGCEVVPFADVDAHEVGALLRAARLSDVVDAHVVLMAMQRSATIVTSDPDDLGRLCSTTSRQITIKTI